MSFGPLLSASAVAGDFAASCKGILASALIIGVLTGCSNNDRLEELENRFNASEKKTEQLAKDIDENFKNIGRQQNDIINHLSHVCFEDFGHYIKMFPCTASQRRQLVAQWKYGV